MTSEKREDSPIIFSNSVELNGILKTNQTVSNGTETVTISNVAPSGVGTATISGWLVIKNSAGTDVYIPFWT